MVSWVLWGLWAFTDGVFRVCGSGFRVCGLRLLGLMFSFGLMGLGFRAGGFQI